MEEFASISVLKTTTHVVHTLDDHEKVVEKIKPAAWSIKDNLLVRNFFIIKVFNINNIRVKSSTSLLVEVKLCDDFKKDYHLGILNELINRVCKYGSWGYTYVKSATLNKMNNI